MKRAMCLTAVVLATMAGRACIRPMAVLYAQTVPVTRPITWSPNPAAENVTDYQVALDVGTAVTVLPAACTATTCTGSITIPTFGGHVWSVVARNQQISCTNGTCTPPVIQSGAPATMTFTLNQAPSAPGNQTIK